MGARYSHLSLFERQRMFVWHHYEKLSNREIGRRLGRSHTTIGRELKRNLNTAENSFPRHYVDCWYPHPSQKRYQHRIRIRGTRPRLKNEKTQQFVETKLKLGWSPEIISGRLKLNQDLDYASHESIYQYIYLTARQLIKYLPRHHKKRRKKYPKRKYPLKIEAKTSILERPETINNRAEPGHWETDTLESTQHKPGCNVLVERQTRLVHITPLESKKSNDTQAAVTKRLSSHPDNFIRSITYDNGPENAQHLEINKSLNCQSYFCQPYHSWEKGSVEQMNSLIRRFFPKRTDFTKVKPEALQRVEFLLNNRPRKCLGYKTPLEVYNQLRGALTP